MEQLLKKRADDFFEGAKYFLTKQKFNLAAFHLEQGVQLYLKYQIYLKLGEFPQIDSLNKLLEELGKAYNKKKLIEKFLEKNYTYIISLETAYILTRYLQKEYTKKEIDILLELSEKITGMLKNDFS